MIQHRALLYINPFYFKDGTTPKPKYCLVIDADQDGFIIVNLPSSKVRFPYPEVNIKPGCIELKDVGMKFFCLQKDVCYTDTEHIFSQDTFLYPRWVDEWDLKIFEKSYGKEGQNYRYCGKVNENTFLDILYCLSKAPDIKKGMSRKLIKVIAKTF